MTIYFGGVKFLYEEGFDENQLFTMTNHHGGSAYVRMLAEKIDQLIELGFTQVQLTRMGKHEGSAKGLKAVLVNYSRLHEKLTNEQILSGSRTAMEALLLQVKESRRAQPNAGPAASGSGRPLPDAGEEPPAKRWRPWE